MPPDRPVDAGLTSLEARARLERGGPNELPAPPTASFVRRVGRHLVEPLSLVLLAAALVSGLALHHGLEAAAIAAIVALNAGFGAVEELRADHAIAALNELTAPRARVRRDGVTVAVDAREVVPGDLVEMAAGDRVPADATLVEAASLSTDESMLTGESMPVEHAEGDAVFAGTMVVRGRGLGVAAATGAATEIGQIATALAAPSTPPLVVELRRVALVMSVVAIALGALLVPIAALRNDGGSTGDAVLAGVALAVAAIPEGLATVVTLSLALGARAMARGGAIVRSLPALETLGSTTIICADKTGTLTTGEVVVAAVHAVGDEQALWSACLRCVDLADGTGDPIDEAVAVAAGAAGVHPDPAEVRVADRPFDASTRSMTTVVLVDGDARLTVKGAPEEVLDRCPPTVTADLRRRADELTAAGLRVLAVAEAASDDLDAVDLEPVGLIGFADPLRASATEAVLACRRAGIRVVMVTGDHLATASAIARAAGLDDGPAVTGAELESLPPAEAVGRLQRAPVVARVLPRTKVDLVRAHQSAGETVAMTGDGVNDAPALRAADIGVAIAGEGGSDVAREAAGLVVTSGDLGVIVEAVREGRRIYRNIATVVGYLLAGNLSEILVVAGCLVLVPELDVPLYPVQLLWLNLISDGLPALALGVDRQAVDPLLGPPRRAVDRLLSPTRVATLAGRAAAMAGVVLLATLWARGRGWSETEVRSQLLLSLVATHLVFAYANRATSQTFEAGWWRNRTLLAAIAGSLLLQATLHLTPAGRALLDLAEIPPAGWLVAGGAAAGAIVLIDAGRAVRRLVAG